jgi:hypothetical protein
VNKNLDDLISQADKQLQELETEFQKKEAASSLEQEVSHDAALRFNEPSEKNSYAARHPKLVGFASLAFASLIATQIYISLTLPRATGPYHLVNGTVQSSSIIWSGRIHYGSVAASKVKLPDGRTVMIRLDSGRLLPVGTSVAFRVYDTGAVRTDRWLL